MPKIFETPLYSYARSPDQDAEKPALHPVVVVGAGPVGLAAAIELAQSDIPVLVLDDNDKVSWGSRAICFAKRPLEILDRLGCGNEFVDKGVQWQLGKVFVDVQKIYEFDLQPEGEHQRPAFINLQQYYFEEYLINRLRQLQDEGKPVELRGKNKVVGVDPCENDVGVTIETPEGNYQINADWLIACDGANSPVRSMMDLDFVGHIFEDNFLIADIVMKADFPAERRFWFDPPFNPGQSVLLHSQPDNVWRVDFQLGWDIDKEEESKPENVSKRLKSMFGEDAEFELEWVSVYTFQCRRMKDFRHNRVLFAGDSAHQVSPFGARGANSGLQDSDNLIWKLKLVIEGKAPDNLLDSYNAERVYAAEENILNSTRSTDFITPKSDMSKIFRDAVLELASDHEFARPLVNTGRLSVPAIYDGSSLNGPDVEGLPTITRPGASASDAPISDGWLMQKLGGHFQLITINTDAPETLNVDGIKVKRLALSASDENSEALKNRYLGDRDCAVYLMRPDQHIAARWINYDEKAVRDAVNKATGKV